MTNKTFKYFLEDHTNKIQAFFKDSKSIKVLDGSSNELNRYKHSGAQLLVDGVYYFFTTSQFNDNNHLYLTLNKGQIKYIEESEDIFKVVLINRNNFTIFDKLHIIDDRVTLHKIEMVPLECADEIWPLRMLPSTLSFKTLQPVSYGAYKINNKFHSKTIIIKAPEYKFTRKYKSIVEAYCSLTGTKIDKTTHRPVGKPVENAAYKKSYKSFLRDIKAENLQLINNKGHSFKAVTEIVDNFVHNNYIIYNNIYNIVEVDTSVTENRNNKQIGGSHFDKQLNKIADKLVESEENNVSEQSIKASVLSFGSNRNMLKAYIDGLHNKGCDKEVDYAMKLFDLLNTISL